jgi:hypothetical protein
MTEGESCCAGNDHISLRPGSRGNFELKLINPKFLSPEALVVVWCVVDMYNMRTITSHQPVTSREGGVMPSNLHRDLYRGRSSKYIVKSHLLD